MQAAKLSLYTPFKIKEEFVDIDEDESLEMLRQAVDVTLQRIDNLEILNQVTNESDLLFFFDCLMQDYVTYTQGMDIEQFRAVLFRNYLLRMQADDSAGETPLTEKETPEVQLLENVCNRMYALTQHAMSH